MVDVKIIESNDGGEMVFRGRDIQQVEGWGNMPYIALFGGNVEQSTPAERAAGEQLFDWWGNLLFHPDEPELQFNSETERTLNTVALNSTGRLLIEQAVKRDLKFMEAFGTVSVTVVLPGLDRVEINIRILQPENQTETQFIFIWDGTLRDLLQSDVSIFPVVVSPFRYGQINAGGLTNDAMFSTGLPTNIYTAIVLDIDGANIGPITKTTAKMSWTAVATGGRFPWLAVNPQPNYHVRTAETQLSAGAGAISHPTINTLDTVIICFDVDKVGADFSAVNSSKTNTGFSVPMPAAGKIAWVLVEKNVFTEMHMEEGAMVDANDRIIFPFLFVGDYVFLYMPLEGGYVDNVLEEQNPDGVKISQASPVGINFIAIGTMADNDALVIAFRNRVNAASGTWERLACLYNEYVRIIGVTVGAGTAYDAATFMLSATAWIAAKMLTFKPNTTTGDMSFARASTAYRYNQSGIFELMANDIPRLDYRNGGCPVWLFQPARTNLATYSQTLQDRTLLNSTRTQAYGEFEIFPGEPTVALRETAVTDVHASTFDYTVVNGVVYVVSIFVRSIGGRDVRISGSSGFSGICIVNLATGEMESTSTANAMVTSFGNGIYRISFSNTATSTVGRVLLYSTIGGNTTFLGDTAKGIEVLGLQIEAGVTPTSLIKTGVATASRVQDVSTRTDLQSQGYVGAAAGSLFLDIENSQNENNSGSIDFNIFASANDGIRLSGAANTITGLSVIKNVGGVLTSIYEALQSPQNVRYLFTWSAGTLSVYANGYRVVNATPAAFTNAAFTSLTITGGKARNGFRNIMLFNTAISNSEALDLSGFDSLNDLLSFIGYASDDPALYSNYL